MLIKSTQSVFLWNAFLWGTCTGRLTLLVEIQRYKDERKLSVRFSLLCSLTGKWELNPGPCSVERMKKKKKKASNSISTKNKSKILNSVINELCNRFNCYINVTFSPFIVFLALNFTPGLSNMASFKSSPCKD